MGTVGGAPVYTTGAFLAVAIVLGVFAGSDVSGAILTAQMPAAGASIDELIRVFEASGAPESPSFGWVLGAGFGVAVVYMLSIFLHELGHLVAARLAGVDVSAMHLHVAGGHVDIDDDDRLTAARLAAIAGAGPLVTAGLVLAAGVALTILGWPLSRSPASETSAAIAIGRVLSAAFVINAIALVVNLLPIRALDGGQLLAAGRLWRSRRG